jgi:CO/xanthine dehydrogenase FAD-binding subunit
VSGDAVSPRSLGEATAWLAERPGLLPIAGCTDVLVPGAWFRAHSVAVMDLLQVPELRGVTVAGEILSIGAATTFAEIGQHEEIRRRLPSLSAAAGLVGGWQIQTRATVGGNIANASPAGDSLPVWLALNASLVLAGPKGSRRLPYDAVHVGYRQTAIDQAEIIHRVEVPRPEAGTRLLFRKVGGRQALAISKVVVAAALTMADGEIARVRIAAGSVAPTPVRLTAVEAFLSGRRPTVDVADEAGRLAASSVRPVDDVRSTAAYRAHVLERIVRRWVLDAGSGRA